MNPYKTVFSEYEIMDDARLAGLSSQGNERAFTVFVSRYKGWAKDVLHRLFWNKEKEDEAYQLFVMKVWKAFSSKKYKEEGRMRGWLNTVLTSAINEIRKRRNSFVPVDLDESLEAMNSMDRGVQQFETMYDIISVLAHMDIDTENREIMKLHLVNGLNDKQIARIKHTTPKAIEDRLYRMRRDLKRWYAAMA
jgi:RNA polymerase sigma factor (sigma-70 family)